MTVWVSVGVLVALVNGQPDVSAAAHPYPTEAACNKAVAYALEKAPTVKLEGLTVLGFQAQCVEVPVAVQAPKPNV